MRRPTLSAFRFLILLLAGSTAYADTTPLPGTGALALNGDLSAEMVAGIDRYLERELAGSIDKRAQHWQRNLISAEAYEASVAPNRERLARIIGAVDPRPAQVEMEWLTTVGDAEPIAETESYRIFPVQWKAFGAVHGEGLLLQPRGEVRARIVALPDADQTPEMLAGLVPGVPPAAQFARRLAENGAQVIVPVLIDRRDTWSGNVRMNRFTNQPHREWIYRPAYQMGRHIIGYEVQKVLAAVDWLAHENEKGRAPIGVVGYAEGGLLAFHAAALDPRITATLVSGYFDSRQKLWSEPVYRNVFGLLREFGAAETASLIAPRALVIEHSHAPEVAGPPAARTGRSGAAPGAITTADSASVAKEFARAQALSGPTGSRALQLFPAAGREPVTAGSSPALAAFWNALRPGEAWKKTETPLAATARSLPNPDERQHRQLLELEEHTQSLVRYSDQERNRFFWQKQKPASAAAWTPAMRTFKQQFHDDIIGRLEPASVPINPRTRQVHDRPSWTGYEVVLDVRPDIFAWGLLLVPKDLKPGERRPVVVCQHGLEGLPEDVITEDPTQRVAGVYKAFAARLAERGFIVFAPHNPYRGGEDFRQLTRKLNPLKQTLFSVIVAQHERILDWLSAQPFVDPERIGFYGLSYGGKTAMRVPALLERYALSICSADFNDWIRKTTTVDAPMSYVFTKEYEIAEFNLGHTFNYAEMAALIAPRPFMVERGHFDGVAPDEWVAYEFAKVRRLYSQLKIPERARIEFFNGPHAINAAGTFEFLHEHLQWPKR